jgi:hypothetical protein
MRKKYIFALLIMVFVVSMVASSLNLPVAAAVEAEVVSKYVDGDLPLADPNSTMWTKADSLDVPLSGQTAVAPKNLLPSVSSMRIRSLNNHKWIAFLLEWDDPTKDIGGGLLDFKDSVAIQFPSEEGEPFYCMGQSGGSVEILHWRGDFQQDIENGAPNAQTIFPNMWSSIYPAGYESDFLPGRGAGNIMSLSDRITPVEDLVAGGAGTLTTQSHNDGVGWAEWTDGKWKAVIGRPMITTDEDDAQFDSGMSTSFAVAAWDGGKAEIDGKKAVSTWLNLKVDATSETLVAVGEGGEVPSLSMNILLFTVSGFIVLLGAAVGTTWVIARRR